MAQRGGVRLAAAAPGSRCWPYQLLQLEGKGLRGQPPIGGRTRASGAHRDIGLAVVAASNPMSDGGLWWCG
jgi:hypothetical protein